MEKTMRTFTAKDLNSWEPCYNPVTDPKKKFLPADWSGTAIDFLKIEVCPPEDRLWVVLRQELIDANTLRLFAVYCARTALSLVPNPDPRSVAACDVAERFANGKATNDELAAADAAARAAAAAARAAYAAAADAAAYAADDAAAYAAARAAAAAAADDAAARAAQVKKLIEMLEA
jgi:hypothetical protein